MLVTEFLEPNKSKHWMRIQNSPTYRISFLMIVYWLVINVVLFSLLSVVSQCWQLISGFNLGFIGALIGFLILAATSKWFFSKVPLKQVFAYATFLLRIAVYGLIVGLAIAFSFFNLFSLIGGFSLIIIGTLTSELLFFRKGKKAKAEC